jgi:hypothetical protein
MTAKTMMTSVTTTKTTSIATILTTTMTMKMLVTTEITTKATTLTAKTIGMSVTTITTSTTTITHDYVIDFICNIQRDTYSYSAPWFLWESGQINAISFGKKNDYELDVQLHGNTLKLGCYIENC